MQVDYNHVYGTYSVSMVTYICSMLLVFITLSAMLCIAYIVHYHCDVWCFVFYVISSFTLDCIDPNCRGHLLVIITACVCREPVTAQVLLHLLRMYVLYT